MFILSFVKIISILLSIVGVTFLFPIGVAVAYGETHVILPFLVPTVVSVVTMLAVNLPTRKYKIRMSIKQTFIIVAAAWVCISIMGAIPLYFSGAFPRFVDALFESVSGFSTTGATVCTDVEVLPRSINLGRCLYHWIGGMGIVTLTVALMPLLGVGGFQLIKAETTGPEKGKVTARITTTAKILWLIYIGMTVVETILLMIFGMDFVDAVTHAFSTVGTGGFSSKNDSIGAYNSLQIDITVTVFMFLCGINFSLFFYLITKKFSDIRENTEFKVYVGIVVVIVLAVSFCLLSQNKHFGQNLHTAAFHVVSAITTTGFSIGDFTIWPYSAQFLLFLLFFIGGCSGSTGGGIKVVRWVILFKQINNETKRMLHPHGVFSIRLNNRVGRKDIVFNVTAFIALYLFFVGLTTFIGCLGDLDIFSSFSGALSMVGNIGLAYGSLGPGGGFADIPDFVKIWYSFAMLAGRLELYTMIIYFMPSYWKK